MLEIYNANYPSEKQGIDYRLYQFLYYNKIDFWGLEQGFYSLIEEMASYLSQPKNRTRIELNTEVTRLGTPEMDVRRYYSRDIRNRRSNSIMQPLKDTVTTFFISYFYHLCDFNTIFVSLYFH